MTTYTIGTIGTKEIYELVPTDYKADERPEPTTKHPVFFAETYVPRELPGAYHTLGEGM